MNHLSVDEKFSILLLPSVGTIILKLVFACPSIVVRESNNKQTYVLFKLCHGLHIQKSVLLKNCICVLSWIQVTHKAFF